MDRVRTSTLESLAAELETWRKATFDQLVIRRWRPKSLTAAVSLARDIQADKVRMQDVRALLIAIVETAGRGHSSAMGADRGSTVSNPAVIRAIFGLTSSTKNATTRQRQETAGHAIGHGVSWHTVRRHSMAHVDQLVEWTLSYLRGPDKRPASTIISSSQSDTIVRHSDLSWLGATYRKLLATGGIFVIWGVPGCGKTTLAMQFARQVAPEGRFIGSIRIGRRGLFEEDLRHILRIEGVDTSAWADDQCLAFFRTAAPTFRAIRLVILDGVRDENDIVALLPHGCAAPVLITTVRQPLSTTDSTTPSFARQLMPLTTNQSYEFLKNRLPWLDEPTVSNLALVLGGHVETMHHVVRYLATENAVIPGTLLEEITHSTRRTLIDLSEVLGVPASLPIAVQRLYDQVADDPLSRAILTSIIWANGSGEQPRQLITEIASRLLHHPTELELQASLLRLERLGLLTSTEKSFVIPRLTAHILRDLLMDTREPTLVAYEQVVALPPDPNERLTLLQILRHEYKFLDPLRLDLAKALGNMRVPLPALLALDDSNWALFTSDEAGRRHVEVYRTTQQALLHLRSNAHHWQQAEGDEVEFIVELTSKVYPTIEAGWRRATVDMPQ